jgi:hypothetical protein
MRVYKFLDAQFGLKSLHEKRLKISRIDDLNDPFELLPYDHTDPNLRQAFIKTRDDVGLDRGVLCFSADWSDPVIWAHYSDKHRGLCLGFEIPAIQEDPKNDEIMKVKYESKPLPFPNDYLNLAPDQWPAVVQTVLSTKFENWKYEKEIRMWVPLLEKGKEGELYFLNFGENLQLVEVILGVRYPLPTTTVLQELGPLASNVSVIKARAAHNAFEMVKDEEFH